MRPTKWANEAKREGKVNLPGKGDDKFMRDYIAGKDSCYTADDITTGEGPQVEITK